MVEKGGHLQEIGQMQIMQITCTFVYMLHVQVHMVQDLCAGFSLENAITDQFTPPPFSMLHLSLAKCISVEMKHGNGLCL